MSTTELDADPGTLGLYARAIGAMVLPGGGGGTLPDDVVVRRELALDRDHLLAYQRVCGFDLSDELPPTYLHVVGFPMSLAIMTRRDFPFPLPGMVHVANRITQHRPLTVDDRPTLSVSVRDLRAHRAGRVLDVVAAAELDGGTVWEDVSTYLVRGAGRDDDAPSPGPDDAPERSPAAPTWRIPADVGRRYAAASGDRNPIHLTAVTARAFGFPRAIAHGMWTTARLLSALPGRLPDAYTVGVRFERPLLLPSTVALTTDRSGDGTIRAALHAAGTTDHRHLTGRIDPS